MTSFIVRLGNHSKNCKQSLRWGAETLTGGFTGLLLLNHLAIDVRDYETTTRSSVDICPPRHMVSLVHNEFKIDASRYPAKAGRLKIRIYFWFYSLLSWPSIIPGITMTSHGSRMASQLDCLFNSFFMLTTKRKRSKLRLTCFPTLCEGIFRWSIDLHINYLTATNSHEPLTALNCMTMSLWHGNDYWPFVNPWATMYQ